MSIAGASGTRELEYNEDFYLSADALREEVELDDVPVAFVGYGVSAPGLGYDDYADIDGRWEGGGAPDQRAARVSKQREGVLLVWCDEVG